MYMNNLLLNIKNEFKYQYYSKYIIGLLLILFTLICFNFVSLRNSIFSNYELFNKTALEYKNENLNIEEALKEPVNIVDLGNEGNIIDNVLRYDFENLLKSIDNIKPSKITSQMLAYLSFIFFPIIFGIYGVLVSNYDLKFRTLKLRLLFTDIKTYILSKVISISVVSIVVLFILMLVSIVISYFLYGNISSNPELSKFIDISIPLNNSKNILIQILFSLFIILLFSNLGFCIGILTRNVLTSSLIICIYILIIPNLGKYDLKNTLIGIGNKLFEFSSNFQLASPIGSLTFINYFILFFIFILSILLPIIIENKRSHYI